MSKIVILTQYFPPEMGAPQSRLFETAVGLQKRGYGVRVIAAMPNYPTGAIFDGYKARMRAVDLISDVPVFRYWLYASNSRQAIPRIVSMVSFSISALASVFWLRRFKPDFIFTESPPLTLAVSGLWLARACGAKHVLNVSDIWPLSALELGAVRKGWIYRGLEALEAYLYRKSDACTGQSMEIVRHLNERGARRSNLFRNGVEVDRFSHADGVASESRLTKKFVYAGLLGVAQGIHDLCREVNFADLGAELHIYGAGAERASIEALVDDGGIRGIYLHPPAPREEVPALLVRHDVAIIPLVKPIYGAVPSKIYEAMAAGLPILFSGGGEGARIILAAGAGWACEPSTFGSIRSIIREITGMTSDELRVIGRRSRNAAEQFFSREIQIDSLAAFLRSMSEPGAATLAT